MRLKSVRVAIAPAMDGRNWISLDAFRMTESGFPDEQMTYRDIITDAELQAGNLQELATPARIKVLEDAIIKNYGSLDRWMAVPLVDHLKCGLIVRSD